MTTNPVEIEKQSEKQGHRRAAIFSVVVLCAIVISVWLASSGHIPRQVAEPGSRSVPVIDFSAYPAGRERKQAFVDYFLPLIEQANERITQNRLKLLALRDKTPLGYFDRNWLMHLAQDYGLSEFRLDNALDWVELIRRVDTISPSLALAQSANESGWGTSRFARQGNNYFGQWCFRTGCGLIPAARSLGSTHEVEVFGSPMESVERYMRNLNTHKAYALLRDIRAELRFQNKVTSGADLAEGLLAYSARRWDYVTELQKMIRYNGWSKFDLL